MKKIFSLCLTVALLLNMMPMAAMATTGETRALLELEETIKGNSKAEIRDAGGNVVETLCVDVQVQQTATSRSSDGTEYSITCSARSINNDEYSDSDTQDGYIAVLTMVCKDVPGTENILISVSGNFSDEDADTDNRVVSYSAYDVYDNLKSAINKSENVPWSYVYTPVDFVGFTFVSSATARITETGNYLYMYVTTD